MHSKCSNCGNTEVEYQVLGEGSSVDNGCLQCGCSLIWFFLSHFGWQAALAASLALPIVLFAPVLIWAAVVSGLSLVIRDAVRRRAIAPSRRAIGLVREVIPRKVR